MFLTFTYASTVYYVCINPISGYTIPNGAGNIANLHPTSAATHAGIVHLMGYLPTLVNQTRTTAEPIAPSIVEEVRNSTATADAVANTIRSGIRRMPMLSTIPSIIHKEL